MDKTTLPGVVFAVVMILVGQRLEGGHASSLVQLTAFLIVMGGAIGAVMVNYPMADLAGAMRGIKIAITDKKSDIPELITQIVELATVARRDGVLALESKLADVKDPFLKRALGFLVDGVEASVARSSLETEIDMETEERNVHAKVWESLGAFAPTVGILGAVLGLIHVMENLDDPSKLGGGIATAFVATVYGVGFSNLVFLPIGGKLKRKAGLDKERKVLIAEGILAIQEGLNPRILEEKLKAYAGSHAGHGKAAEKK